MDFNKNNTIIDISNLFSSPGSVLRVVGDISGHELPVAHGVLVLRVPHVGHAPHALRVAGRRQIGVHPGAQEALTISIFVKDRYPIGSLV